MASTRGSKPISATEKKETSPPPPPPTPPQTTSISDTHNELQQTQITQQQPDPVVESGSEYESFREQRIKENRQRLQNLGIVDLSLKLKSLASSRRIPRQQSQRKTPLKCPLPPSGPVRRSSRLQNVTPVSYTEKKEDTSKRSNDIVMEEGAKPEVYTEEHEKLLGSTEMPWTFFVDGYRSDGTRIYDPINGKTCHQCRQKTMGLRTHCCQCNLVQGQFCGDCLYMRYGEHVLEAKQNPNWICPACRGICNCSLCRQAKGWPATGSLYKKISSLGFKSVAHYLITTKRAPPNSDSKSSEAPQSAKRALPFDGTEAAGDIVSEQEVSVDDEAEVKESKIIPETGNQPNMTSESVGRSRKRFKRENDDDEEYKPEKIDVSVDDEAEVKESEIIPETGNQRNLTSESVGRSRKRFKRENDDDDEYKPEKIDVTVKDAPTSNALKT